MELHDPFARHVGQTIFLLVVALGPIPLCLRMLHAFRRDIEPADFGHAHITLFLCWYTLQTTLALLLGLLHQFQLRAVLLAEGLLLVAGVVSLVILGRSAKRASLTPLLWPKQPSIPQATLLVLFFFVTCLSLWGILSKPTHNFDSLAYHLPVMAQWVRTMKLTVLSDLHQLARYPFNMELVSALVAIPFGDDLLVALPNLLAWIALGLAVTLLGRQMGASSLQSLAAALLVLTTRSMLSRINAVQPDITVAAFFLAGLYFGLRFAQRESELDLAMLLCSLAQLAGLKMSCLPYVVLLLAAVLAARCLNAREAGRRWQDSLRVSSPALRTGLLVLAVAFLPAIYWYGRNLLDLGNPLGFIELKVGRTQIFAGDVTQEFWKRTALASVFDAARLHDWRILTEVILKFLGLRFVLMLFLGLAALVGTVRGSLRAPKRSAIVLFALVMLTAIVYWHSPYSGDNGTHDWKLTPWFEVGLRYGYVCLGVLGVTAAMGLRVVGLQDPWVVGLSTLSCLLGVMVGLKPGAPASIAALGLALVLVLAQRRIRLPVAPRALISTGVALAFVIFLGVSWRARAAREVERNRFYGPLYSFMEAQVEPTATVGYVNMVAIYPLVGRAWTRDLVAAEPSTDSYEEWVRCLKAKGISVVVVGQGPAAVDALAVERVQRWLLGEPPEFELLQRTQYQGEGVSLYRLRRLDGSAQGVPSQQPCAQRTRPVASGWVRGIPTGQHDAEDRAPSVKV
jgi:hypothetical protein